MTIRPTLMSGSMVRAVLRETQTGKVRRAQKALKKPLKRKKPTTYFVNSMGDLFHEDVPDEWIDQVFAVMALCPQHTFQILTKRPERMREYIVKGLSSTLKLGSRQLSVWYCMMDTDCDIIDRRITKWPLPNVWLGVSVEDQTTADLRIPLLLETPAEVRFVSCEPLLGPVDLEGISAENYGIYALSGVSSDGSPPSGFSKSPKLDLVICGGESGPNARPMHPDWVRSLRDQCVEAGVPFHFKQWGPKTAGRLLDGREWLEMPEVLK